MKKILGVVIIFIVACCSSDHKNETISNYIQYVWKRKPSEIKINKLEEVGLITGKDSIKLLIDEYAKDINPKPTLDTILSRIDRDIDYNSQLLVKAKQQVDSLTSFQKNDPNDEVVKTLLKSSNDLQTLTIQQIDELKYYRSAFKKYSDNKDKVFSYVMLCNYQVKGHAPDTTSKVITQTFYLSPDTRSIFLVK